MSDQAADLSKVVFLRAPGRVSAQEAERLRAEFADAVPGFKAIILSDGADVVFPPR
ncbi:hypothetical protein [Cereibacter sphaeroides]|uniref:hypothetical protein n=1 Tax=Cereibacter sphaeroides TaxID=1063 RepID=UPI0015FB4B13|nr:hypothetical protein [Cereibacter sphaeroides]